MQSNSDSFANSFSEIIYKIMIFRIFYEKQPQFSFLIELNSQDFVSLNHQKKAKVSNS